MNNEKYVTLEQLESLFSEDGYICFGHGTGRKSNSDEVVDEIFNNGLRTKDNSLYFTTIGLSTPTPYMKSLYRELELPKPSIEGLKKQLDNWEHLNSKRIIIARLPMEYINMRGDRSDLDGEQYGAFYIEKQDLNGKITYYLNPKFIVGCYDAEKGLIRLNNKYEKDLNASTIKELKMGYKKALEKTNERLKKTALPFRNISNSK